VKVINSFILATGRLAASRQQRRTERLIHFASTAIHIRPRSLRTSASTSVNDDRALPEAVLPTRVRQQPRQDWSAPARLKNRGSRLSRGVIDHVRRANKPPRSLRSVPSSIAALAWRGGVDNPMLFRRNKHTIHTSASVPDLITAVDRRFP